MRKILRFLCNKWRILYVFLCGGPCRTTKMQNEGDIMCLLGSELSFLECIIRDDAALTRSMHSKVGEPVGVRLQIRTLIG